jgi:RNA polymerase sigma-70 factor, ECF subfamily
VARRALWRSGAAKDAVPRIAHLDRDRSLVEDAKRDPARFDALYRRYLARVYSYAYYELGDHHLAEDATEATFVSALTNLHRFEERARPADGDGASTFRVWLFQIARNEVAGERRRMRRRPTEPLGESVVTDPLDVESAAVQRDEARAAWRAVGRLPGERRQAMILRFVDELSTAEIAGVLGRSEGAVRVLIHRALRSVARDMGDAKAPGAPTRSKRDGRTTGADA